MEGVCFLFSLEKGHSRTLLVIYHLVSFFHASPKYVDRESRPPWPKGFFHHTFLLLPFVEAFAFLLFLA